MTIVMNGVVMIHFSDEQVKNQTWLPKLVVVRDKPRLRGEGRMGEGGEEGEGGEGGEGGRRGEKRGKGGESDRATPTHTPTHTPRINCRNGLFLLHAPRGGCSRGLPREML